jgi:hypothetical protein
VGDLRREDAVLEDRFTDDVAGVVIGRYLRRGRVYYQDRPQGPPIFAESEEAVLAIAKECIAEMQNGPAGALIYPDPAWTVRLYAE